MPTLEKLTIKRVMDIIKKECWEIGYFLLSCPSCESEQLISTGLLAKLQNKELKLAREWLKEHVEHVIVIERARKIVVKGRLS